MGLVDAITVNSPEHFFAWFFFVLFFLCLGAGAFDNGLWNALIAHHYVPKWAPPRGWIYSLIWLGIAVGQAFGATFVRAESSNDGWGTDKVLVTLILFTVQTVMLAIWPMIFFTIRKNGRDNFGWAIWVLLATLGLGIATTILGWTIRWEAGLSFLWLPVWLVYALFINIHVWRHTRHPTVLWSATEKRTYALATTKTELHHH